MALATGIALAGLVAGGVGTLVQNKANRKAASQANALANQGSSINRSNVILENRRSDAALASSKEQAAISRKQEALRKDQTVRDFSNRQRNIIRQRQVARAAAVTGAANAGGLQSSGIQGGVGQIDQSAGANLVAGQETFAAGQENFGLNEQLTRSQERFNAFSTSLSKRQAALGTRSADINAQIQQIRPSQTGSLISSIGSSVARQSDPIARTGQFIFG